MLRGVVDAPYNKTSVPFAAIFILPSLEEQIAGACALTAPEWRPDVVDLFQRWHADQRKAMGRQDCQREGGWGATSQIEKERSGALRSFLDGKKRLITTSSFYRHIITRIILSHPVDGPEQKGTNTSTKFRARGEAHPNSAT